MEGTRMGLFKQMKEAMGNKPTAEMMSGAMTMPTTDDRDRAMAQGNEYKRLMEVGLIGSAVITSATDSGERAAGNMIASLELDVKLEGGEPYPVSMSFMIAGTDLGPYAPGSAYPVRIDPADRENVTFG
jgi:hypothetical protein